MRIVIDLQGAQTESRFRGIGRYSLSLAKAIVRNRGEHEVVIALSGLFSGTIEQIRADFDTLLPQKNIRVWYVPSPVKELAPEPDNAKRREIAELMREAFLLSLQPDIIYIASLFEGYEDDAVTSIGRFDKQTPVVCSFYDLIPLLNPEQYLVPSTDYEQYYQRKIQYLKQASLLLAISKHSQQEAIESLNLPIKLVANISTAVENNFKVSPLSKLKSQCFYDKFGLTRLVILYTGGSDERKNLPRLIRAYSRLSIEFRNRYQLVFAGRIPEHNVKLLTEEAVSAGLQSEELIFTGHVTDDELVSFYNICELYAFPSWHEGFGLPALEAMSCGAAVIAANTTSLPEVIGNDDALFDPLSETAIARKIERVLRNEDFRQGLIEAGLKQAKAFSWDRSAKLAINEFEFIFESQNSILKIINIEELRANLIKAIASQKILTDTVTEKDLCIIADAISKNISSDHLPTMFIDVSQLVIEDFKTGIQRVVNSITRELLRLDLDCWHIEPVYLTNDKGVWQYRYAATYKDKLLFELGLLPKRSWLTKLKETVGRFKNEQNRDGIITPSYNDIFLGLDLYNIVSNPIQQGLFSRWRDIGVKIHFVIYDILPIISPHWWPEDTWRVHAHWLNNVSQVADTLISISKSVSDSVQEYLANNPVERVRPLKFEWFHLGADINNVSLPQKMNEGSDKVLEQIKGNISFLMVGTIEPRKGHAQTLAALDCLWADGIDVNLVIVGKEGWLVEAVIEKIKNHVELGKRLFWLEGISDEYLEKIYAASTCLIAASEGEGFGLPLIEAAQKSLPIIARDIPVFREVCGVHAFFFNSLGSQTMADAIRCWMTLNAEGKAPQSSEIPWITWEESSKQLLQPIINSASNSTVNQRFLKAS